MKGRKQRERYPRREGRERGREGERERGREGERERGREGPSQRSRRDVAHLAHGDHHAGGDFDNLEELIVACEGEELARG